VAVVGIGLIGLGTVAEAAVDLLVGPYPSSETLANRSRMWLPLRPANLAVVGFFGAELVRRPVRGGRRVLVLAPVGVLTGTLIVDSTAMGSARAVAIAGTTGVYLLARGGDTWQGLARATLCSSPKARPRPVRVPCCS
jgi:hypothetical protein